MKMEYKYETEEFHSTLEPMVIINDGLSPEEVTLILRVNFFVFLNKHFFVFRI